MKKLLTILALCLSVTAYAQHPCRLTNLTRQIDVYDTVTHTHVAYDKASLNVSRTGTTLILTQGSSTLAIWTIYTIGVLPAPTLDSGYHLILIWINQNNNPCAIIGPTGPTGPSGDTGPTGAPGISTPDTLHISIGRYIPTSQSTVNIRSFTGFTATWTQIDSLVTVFGSFNAKVTNPIQQGWVNLNLPLSSVRDTLPITNGVLGCLNATFAGAITTALSHTAQMQWSAPDTNLYLLKYSYSYVTDSILPGKIVHGGIVGATGATGATGAGGGLANNGLSMSGDTTQLGGDLTAGFTLINTQGNGFAIGDATNGDNAISIDSSEGIEITAKALPVSVKTNDAFVVSGSHNNFGFGVNINDGRIETPFPIIDAGVQINGTDPVLMGLSLIDDNTGYFFWHVDTTGRMYVNNEIRGYNTFQIFPEGKLRQGNGSVTVDWSIDSLKQSRQVQAADSSNPSGITYQVLSVGGKFAGRNGDIPVSGAISSRYSAISTNLTNITALALDSLNYVRSADMVTVSGQCTVVNVNASTSSFQVSLPIPSNFFDPGYCAGSGASPSSNTCVRVSGNLTNNTAQLDWRSPTVAATDTFSFVFTYYIR